MKLSFLVLCLVQSIAIGFSSVQKTPDCSVTKGKQEAFVEANAGCFIKVDGRLLLLRHRNGKLGPPAGTFNKGEAAQCTAHRETWEESGLEVNVGALLHQFENGFRLYHCQTQVPVNISGDKKIPEIGQSEIEDLLWLQPEQILASELRFPAQRQQLVELFNKVPSQKGVQ